MQAAQIFKKAVDAGCSDIHIKPGSPPKMRKNGRLIAIPGYEGNILTAENTRLIAHATMESHDLSLYNHKNFEHDYAYELEGVGRFRMNVYKTRGSDALVGRLLQGKPKTLKELGVSSTISRLAAYSSGIIIVTGATGSGKSTTMAGIIDFINKSKPVNIISIEDPIEIMHSDEKASISQREIGVDTESFGDALRSALREDPDVILIGEIRDKETMKTALSAADTGHLVVTTLHTTDTAEAINRILTFYSFDEQEGIRRSLASSLRGIIGQRLVPTVDKGRVAVNEIMVNNLKMAELILNKGTVREAKALIESEEANGMQSFEQHFVRLVKNGTITLQTAKDNSVDPSYYDDPALGLVSDEQRASELVVPNISLPGNLPKTNLPSAPTLGKQLPEIPVPLSERTTRTPAEHVTPVRRPRVHRNPLD